MLPICFRQLVAAGISRLGTISFRNSLRRKMFLVLLSHVFTIFHLLLMPNLWLIPLTWHLKNESILKVRKPTVELPFDREGFGAFSRILRSAISEALSGPIDSHETFHFLERNLHFPLRFFLFHGAFLWWQLGIFSSSADRATFRGPRSVVFDNIRFVDRRLNLSGRLRSFSPQREHMTHRTERQCSVFLGQFLVEVGLCSAFWSLTSIFGVGGFSR